MKLALGTVQFGMDYGVANIRGQIPVSEAKAILDVAARSGVEVLDTAAGYGDSEVVLGIIGVDQFKVITKLPAKIDDEVAIATWAEQHIKASLNRLGVRSVYGLLVHRSLQLTKPAGKILIRAIDGLKANGLINKFGVSIYDPSELELITDLFVPDIVQAPLNLLDRRLVTSGWLKKLHSAGVEVHTRSAFLQGLLLLPRDKIPLKFQRWSSIFDQWHAWLDEYKVDPVMASLSAVSLSMIDHVIVGVDSHAQLEKIVLCSAMATKASFPDISCDDLKLINPSNWDGI